jgi:hypothetical protein
MTAPVAASLYGVGVGTASTANLLPFITTVNPSASSLMGPNGPFLIGQRWINSVNNETFTLSSLSPSGGVMTATWTQEGGAGAGTVTSVTGTASQITSTPTTGAVVVSLPASITTPGSLTTTTSLAATTTVTAGTGITATTGNIVASTGNITATAGNIAATAGSVSAGSTVTAGTGITATTGNIAASSGNVSASGTVTGGTGVTATTGNVSATAGAVNAGTSMTATLGNITATNGNLVMGTIGNKIIVPTGSNASAGTTGVMSGTPGAVTQATTACSATAKVFYCRATTGGTLGNVSITAQDGTGFTLTSTGNETSTFNWWIINA